MTTDWQTYLAQNPDLQAAGLNSEADALWHWNTYGRNEGRQMPGSEPSIGAPTNAPGTGLDAQGNLLPGWQYVTYSNGVGQGTPINLASATNTYAPGSTGANLAGLGADDYARYSTVPSWSSEARQVMARQSPGTTVGVGAQPAPESFGAWSPPETQGMLSLSADPFQQGQFWQPGGLGAVYDQVRRIPYHDVSASLQRQEQSAPYTRYGFGPAQRQVTGADVLAKLFGGQVL